MTRAVPHHPAEIPSARAIADDAPIGIFRADTIGRVTYINHAIERISGVSSKWALGNSWLRSAPAASRKEAKAAWKAAIAAGRNWESEFRFKHPDGFDRYASIMLAAEHDAAGRLCGFTGFVTDITEQRLSERELRKSERRFRLLAENATDIIVRLDLDDHVTYASPAMEEVTGFSAEETRGINPVSFMHPDDRAAAKEISRQLKDGEIEQAVIEYRTPHKDGHFIWAEARSRLVRNSRGEATEVISVVRDISDAKRLQAELIAARHAEQRAAASQSRFLATMSHEIRTPISGVIGMIDLLINSTDDTQLPRYRAALAMSARTLLRVVDDVLDYSRLSSVGIALDLEPVDMLTTVHSVIDLYRPAAEAKGLTLGLQFDATDRRAVCDATRLAQVLGNLVSNAIKFTDAGRIDVAVEQRQQRWSFHVADTGIGIAPDQQKSLFTAFVQADQTIASRFGGTGLGLAIARLIVAAMGGTITLDSMPGHGTRFTVEVMLAHPESDAPATEGEAEDIEQGAPRTMLVADDDAVNLLYLTRVLERMGHRVVAVGDGAAAVAAARAERFDAILLDRHMPALDGERTARAIRAMPLNRDARLILVSAAVAASGEHPLATDSMFDARLAKPARPASLAAALEGGPRRRDPQQATPSASSDVEQALGHDAAVELARLFRSDLLGRLALLDQAIATRQVAAIRDQAHAILGGAGLIGERIITEAARLTQVAAPTTTINCALVLRAACADYLGAGPTPFRASA